LIDFPGVRNTPTLPTLPMLIVAGFSFSSSSFDVYPR
jgi:hypothetical protein